MIRPMIRYIMKNSQDYPLTGCEVGVWEGTNALSILKNLAMDMLFLVDPWKKHRIYSGKLFGQARMDINLMKTIARLISYDSKWHIIKHMSNVGSKHVSSNLDFVYIDAQHTHRNCKEDIKTWYPKVKSGGVFGGHDYNPGVTDGVCLAVDEFVEEYNLDLHQEDIDWWVVKK